MFNRPAGRIAPGILVKGAGEQKVYLLSGMPRPKKISAVVRTKGPGQNARQEPAGREGPGRRRSFPRRFPPEPPIGWTSILTRADNNTDAKRGQQPTGSKTVVRYTGRAARGKPCQMSTPVREDTFCHR
jgi:hypothetical protein